jgi:hypothetical protein
LPQAEHDAFNDALLTAMMDSRLARPTSKSDASELIYVFPTGKGNV